MNTTTNRHRPQNSCNITLLMLVLVVSLSQAPNAISAPGDNMIIPRKGDDAGMSNTPPSIFPHWIHRIRYRCDACHDDVFKMEIGATEITMELMKKKQSCGLCHNGKIAFEIGFSTCIRCHKTEDE